MPAFCFSILSLIKWCNFVNKRFLIQHFIHRKLYSVNFADASKYAANAADEKIYVSDERGRMVCLQPME